jgi:hypothetical protein
MFDEFNGDAREAIRALPHTWACALPPKRLSRLATRFLVRNPDVSQQVRAEFHELGKRPSLPSALHPEMDLGPPAALAG